MSPPFKVQLESPQTAKGDYVQATFPCSLGTSSPQVHSFIGTFNHKVHSFIGTFISLLPTPTMPSQGPAQSSCLRNICQMTGFSPVNLGQQQTLNKLALYPWKSEVYMEHDCSETLKISIPNSHDLRFVVVVDLAKYVRY